MLTILLLSLSSSFLTCMYELLRRPLFLRFSRGFFLGVYSGTDENHTYRLIFTTDFALRDHTCDLAFSVEFRLFSTGLVIFLGHPVTIRDGINATRILQIYCILLYLCIGTIIFRLLYNIHVYTFLYEPKTLYQYGSLTCNQAQAAI